MRSPDLFVELPSDKKGPAAARREVSGCLEALGLAHEAPTVLLIVSELVTNAIVHGSPPVQLTLTRIAEGVRIEVCDGGGTPDDVIAHPLDDLRSRGLHIVDELSASWGADPNGNGKMVWAEYHVE